ncbi:hypothetical protein H2198_002660, partial [Neophaeococcomyces mojaviensis]
MSRVLRRLTQLNQQTATTSTPTSLRAASMYDKSTYFADHPPTIVRLEIKPHFEALTQQQKQYAHHLSRASFSGQRIILAQISPESLPIYDLIISLHKACAGDYKKLAERTSASQDDVTLWLEYAAQFL